jgi:hypothetical protein
MMTAEQYAKMHKEAFRCAFDYLNQHFPPGDDQAWWERTAKDVSYASMSQDDNLLAMELLTAVCNYLEKEYLQRREDDAKTDG